MDVRDNGRVNAYSDCCAALELYSWNLEFFWAWRALSKKGGVGHRRSPFLVSPPEANYGLTVNVQVFWTVPAIAFTVTGVGAATGPAVI
jgi:hypothetical protein